MKKFKFVSFMLLALLLGYATIAIAQNSGSINIDAKQIEGKWLLTKETSMGAEEAIDEKEKREVYTFFANGTYQLEQKIWGKSYTSNGKYKIAGSQMQRTEKDKTGYEFNETYDILVLNTSQLSIKKTVTLSTQTTDDDGSRVFIYEYKKIQ